MPDLNFSVEGAQAVPFAVAPTISFALRVQNRDDSETIHTAVLKCQLRIDPTRRKYAAAERDRLSDLFGAPERWGQTVRSMLWTHATVVVPAFNGSTSLSIPVQSTFDFNVAATKYFAGLSDGEIPLCFLFSGTVFYEDHAGSVQVAPISWEKEANFRLPVATWKEMMDHYYPNIAWLCLRRDSFEALHQYKVRHGIPTWEEAIEALLGRTGQEQEQSMLAKLEGLHRGATNS